MNYHFDWWVRTKSDAQLEFIVKDCTDAIRAMPESDNVLRYFKDKNTAENELVRRRGIRVQRSIMRDNVYDPLKFPLTDGKGHCNVWYRNSIRSRNAVALRDWRSAAVHVGVCKLNERRRSA